MGGILPCITSLMINSQVECHSSDGVQDQLTALQDFAPLVWRSQISVDALMGRIEGTGRSNS